MIRKTLSMIFVLAVLSSTASAWDNVNTHPKITQRAVNFLIQTNSSYSYLANYINFNLASNPQLTFMDEGSVKEDYALSPDWDTSVWGSSQDSNVPSLSWKSHGYDPLSGETWYGIPDFDNAFVYSGSVWSDMNSASNRYFQLGRFVHLIEDMSSVAHAHADFHGTGDDLESYSKAKYNSIVYQPSVVRRPSTDGLAPESGLPHPDLRTDYYGDFIRNVAWRTYYMTSFYGGTLVEREGNYQPDSELKRMFPYSNGAGLRYDDGGWFVNDAYIINTVGYNWIGYGIGNNPDWWECPGDARYFYIENIDGAMDSNTPSTNGQGVVPKVFKINKYRRVKSTDNFSNVLAANSKIFGQLYCENLFPLATEWAAGFIAFSNP